MGTLSHNYTCGNYKMILNGAFPDNSPGMIALIVFSLGDLMGRSEKQSTKIPLRVAGS